MTSSEISDGFGDQRSTPELIAGFERWIHHTAGQMVQPSGLLYDDIVQEGRIAIWRASEKNGGGNSAVYLAQTARWRMLEVATGDRPMIGGDSSPGPKSRPSTVNVDWTEAESGEALNWGNLLVAADILAAVDWAYHEGDIWNALNALPEEHRRYVVLKYWFGLRDVEIEAEMGVGRKVLGTRWARSIKPLLQKSLAHLGATGG